MAMFRSVSPSLVFALFALFALPTAARAQSSSGAEGLGIQVIGGPIFSNLDAATGFDTKQKAGFLVGIGLGGNRGGRVGVEGDILYGKRSAEVNGLNFDTNIVHVPVMLKVNIGSTGTNGFSVFGLGGGFFDWQFSSSLAGIDLTEDTNGFEAGVALGGGVEYLRLSVQGRYLKGLREIDRTFNVANAVASKSKAFAVLFALRLN